MIKLSLDFTIKNKFARKYRRRSLYHSFLPILETFHYCFINVVILECSKNIPLMIISSILTKSMIIISTNLAGIQAILKK
jgi:hypothetical protein